MAAFALLVAFFGGVWAFRGAEAVWRGEFDLEWRGGGGLHVGPVVVGAARRQGVEQYRGLEAVVFGAGLASLGLMLVTLGVSLARALPRPRDPPGVPGRSGLTLALVSWTCLLVGLVGVFPPWRIVRDASTTCFYAGMSGWTAIGWLAWKEIIPQAVSRWGAVILMLAPLAGWLHSAGAAAGFVLAMLALIFLLGHVQYIHAGLKGIPPFEFDRQEVSPASEPMAS